MPPVSDRSAADQARRPIAVPHGVHGPRAVS